MNFDVTTLRREYHEKHNDAERLRSCLTDQLLKLITENDVTLGVPLESRVKSLASIEEKVRRKSLKVRSLDGLPDLVGLRIILIFQGDADIVKGLIENNLNVIEQENAGDKLETSQFGYQSSHFQVKLPESWLAVPTYKGLESIHAEVQVRTLAQHIWAVASHKLQYKREASVPLPLRRAISRASALLETVDLEFSRVLIERNSYIEEELQTKTPTEILNVNSLSTILNQRLPPQNKYGEDEPYDEILNELSNENVRTRSQLNSFISEFLPPTLAEDRDHARSVLKDPHEYDDDEIERARSKAYFTHGGLVRVALQHKAKKERLKP